MRKKVLVMDDEVDVVEILSRKLERADYIPFIAFNGQDGLDIVRNQDVDVILTDLVMPGMDGFQFIRRLKESKDMSEIPVVAFSAYADKEREVREMGVSDFIAKPFDAQKLLETTERVFRKERWKKLSGSVLVLQDRKQDVQQLIFNLVSEGSKLTIKFSENGYDFIIETLKNKPDVIILNDRKDDIPANRMIDILRSYPSLKDLVILVYSSISAPGQSNYARSKGASKMEKLCLDSGATQYFECLDFSSLSAALSEYCPIKLD